MTIDVYAMLKNDMFIMIVDGGDADIACDRNTLTATLNHIENEDFYIDYTILLAHDMCDKANSTDIETILHNQCLVKIEHNITFSKAIDDTIPKAEYHKIYDACLKHIYDMHADINNDELQDLLTEVIYKRSEEYTS